jgi:hypothetical protein
VKEERQRTGMTITQERLIGKIGRKKELKVGNEMKV